MVHLSPSWGVKGQASGPDHLDPLDMGRCVRASLICWYLLHTMLGTWPEMFAHSLGNHDAETSLSRNAVLSFEETKQKQQKIKQEDLLSLRIQKLRSHDGRNGNIGSLHRHHTRSPDCCQFTPDASCVCVCVPVCVRVRPG